jgi:hypothetical protein
MSRLYADENFDDGVVQELRRIGHDVLTANDAGKAGQKIPDDQVLAHAISLGRAVLTFDRWDFAILHKKNPTHHGIIICTRDDDVDALARRVDQGIVNLPSLENLLIRVNRPSVP